MRKVFIRRLKLSQRVSEVHKYYEQYNLLILQFVLCHFSIAKCCVAQVVFPKFQYEYILHHTNTTVIIGKLRMGIKPIKIQHYHICIQQYMLNWLGAHMNNSIIFKWWSIWLVEYNCIWLLHVFLTNSRCSNFCPLHDL